MWYLKLDNSNSVLLLFPLLAFFLCSLFSYPPSFLPPLPPSLQVMLITLYQTHDTSPWRLAHTESALISPFSSNVRIMIKIESDVYGSSFLLFT